MTKFHEISTNEIELIANEINYLFEQYNQIQQFIRIGFPSEYHNLLAKPEKTANSLEWYTNLSGEFVKIESLSHDAKSRMLALYNARRYEIDRECVSLSKTDDYDHQIWATILRSAFHPDNLQLFSNGTDIVLVWGIKTLKNKDYSLPLAKFKDLIIPIDKSEEPSNVENSREEGDFVMEDAESSYSDTTTDPTTINNTSIENTPLEESGSNNLLLKKEEDQNLDAEQQKQINLLPRTQKHWFYAALDHFENFARRFWWLLLVLFLLLALIIYLLLRTPNNLTQEQVENNLTPAEIEEIYLEIMPENPRSRLMPIDTTRFREDEETGSIIIGGLVNVAMVDKKEMFKKMAVDLKRAFPEKDYEITYYDEKTQRLQLSFPEEETVAMKNNIRSRLSAYELLIWDESVFTTSLMFNDPFLKEGDKSWHLELIRSASAWDVTTGDTSVIIAVVDDGFDLRHKEFENTRIVGPYNIISQNNAVYGNASIMHGTHVAALAVGSANNGAGASGVAPGCSFMPVQIGSGGGFFSMTDVVDGVLYALNQGADVINLSLGKFFGEALQGFSPSELTSIIAYEGKDEEKFWGELFRMAEEKNTMIVIAGGNENLPIGLDPMQRTSSAIKVVAVDKSLNKADFSNYCVSCFDSDFFFSAPGSGVFSAIPGNRFDAMDGTSMAAPMVTGAVALMKSKNPGLKNADIRKVLKETARPLSDRSIPSLIQIDAAMQRINH